MPDRPISRPICAACCVFRLLPPYQHGLFATGVQLGWTPHDPEPGTPGRQSNPTLVSNVETFCNVGPILARGAEWYRGFGTDLSPGVIVCTVVGDVARPAVGEVEMGVTLGEVIETVGGGLLPGRSIKAVFSGISNPVILPADLDTPLTYEALSEQRNATTSPSSRGCPRRPAGMSAAASGGGSLPPESCSIRAVAIRPGATVLTVMPSGASSFITIVMPAFEVL